MNSHSGLLLAPLSDLLEGVQTIWPQPSRVLLHTAASLDTAAAEGH